MIPIPSLTRTRFLAFSIAVVVLFVFDFNSLSAQDTKRGLGAGDTSLANSVNAKWNYDWGYQKPTGLNGSYVPMFWSGGNLNTKINAIKGYGDTEYVLGFNEPERADQANMTVANAVNQWRTISNGFAGTGIKLVSPAVSDTVNGRAWLDDFMTQVDNDSSLVIDEVAFHWYGTVNINNPTGTANSFLNKVDQYHNNYNRNVWITEFAGVDFGGNYTDAQMQAWNATFLQTAIAGLESRSYVTRYAWWNHNNDSRLATKDAYGLWRPTQAGDHYYPTLQTGQTRDFNGVGLGLDMQYLRGGSLINSGADLGNGAIGRLYAMSNHDGSSATSSFGGDGDFGFQSWGSVRVEENATLRKVGTNTVTWRGIDIYNDGQITLTGGAGSTLVISGSGTNAEGTGSMRINSGTNLVLGQAGDAAGFDLSYDMIYSGGSVTVDGVGIRLTGSGTITNQTNFIVNQDFVIDGSFVGNNPGLIKSGDATMTLNGNNQYLGFTNVNAGTLIVNGSIGGNDVNVNNGGTLGGSGVLASDIVARSGATVAPGSSTGILSADGASFADGSRLIIEIASLSDFDRLVLTQSLTIDSGATLELSLLDGFNPMLGDEFDVIDFNDSTGMFGTITAPTLSNGLVWDFSGFQGTGTIRISAVPEPSCVSILLLTGVGVLTRRRRLP